MTEAIVSINQLSKRYPSSTRDALKNITLNIKAGEFFGLLGPNGSGKTTLIKLLCGLILANQGDITIDQHSLQHALKEIKPIIGIVPQEIALYNELTFSENLRLFAKLYAIPKHELQDRIDYCLAIAQLAPVADDLVRTYSGGMQRRANLALSLIHRPKLLLLDEPTVNVDPQVREMIFTSLRQLNREGMTIIYTTHYLEEAEQLCSRTAILDQGTIIACDDTAALVKQTSGCNNLGDVFFHLTGKHLRD